MAMSLGFVVTGHTDVGQVRFHSAFAKGQHVQAVMTLMLRCQMHHSRINERACMQRREIPLPSPSSWSRRPLATPALVMHCNTNAHAMAMLGASPNITNGDGLRI